jgi:TrmH family RNA methyltransferase
MKLHDVKKLSMKRYREEFGHFLVEGEHLVLELEKAAETRVGLRSAELYVTHEYEHWRSPFTMHVIGSAQMAQVADTKTPQGIIAVAPIPEGLPALPGERAIYLSEIQDPGNLGTILRTLAWFGGLRCLLGPGSVDPWSPKVVRASAGAIFHVPIEQDVPLHSLRDRYPRIACLDMRGEAIQSAMFHEFDCYLFGNEARGLPQEAHAELPAVAFTIGGTGAIESLNLASTVTLCVYELRRTRLTDGPASAG